MSDEEQAEDLIQVRFLQDFKGAGGPFYKDDIRRLPVEQATRYIEKGRAEDTSGTIPTGKNKFESPVLEAQPLSSVSGGEAG